MTPHPDDLPVDDEQPSAASETTDEAAGQIAIDLYALKVKVPAPSMGEPVDLSPGPPTGVRSWSAVWADCLGHFQDTLIGLAAVLASIPWNSVRVVDGLGVCFQSIAELARRVSRGRARADHNEDERIADVEHGLAFSDPSEGQSQSEAAIARFDDLKSRIRARGVELKPIKTPQGQVIFVMVAPDAERAVAEAAQARLLEHTSDDLDSLGLPVRIVNLLKAEGITSRRRLASLTAGDVLKIRGIGEKSLNALWPFLRRP